MDFQKFIVYFFLTFFLFLAFLIMFDRKEKCENTGVHTFNLLCSFLLR